MVRRSSGSVPYRVQARPNNRHNGHLCEIQVEEDLSSSLAAGGLGESSGFACAVSC